MLAALTGFGLGFLVAAEVGPIWLLCARTAMRSGFLTGLSVGAGAAVVDTAYAGLGVTGAAAVLRVPGVRVAAAVVGAAILLTLGIRTIWSGLRSRVEPGQSGDRSDSRGTAFLTSLAATGSNPLTIASWAAIFAAASGAGVARDLVSDLGLLAGVGVGSLCWFALLSAAGSALGKRLTAGVLRVVDVGSGAGLALFGLLLAVQVLRAR